MATQKMTIKKYDKVVWELAKKEGITRYSYNDVGPETEFIGDKDYKTLNTLLILDAISNLTDTIENRKLAPDPRFDQLAEEIDELRDSNQRVEQLAEEVDNLKRKVKKLKAEVNSIPLVE